MNDIDRIMTGYALAVMPLHHRGSRMTKAWDFLCKHKFHSYQSFMREEKNLYLGASLAQEYQLRTDYMEIYGFSILTDEIVECLRPYAPIVEVGAGSGYWSYECQQAGISCVATDPGTGTYDFQAWKPWTRVLSLTGTKAVKCFVHHTLLMVWPDYNKRWPSQTLRAHKGDIVIYVGEGNGGCTGDDVMHDILETQFVLLEEIKLHNFFGVHDSMYVYHRNDAVLST